MIVYDNTLILALESCRMFTFVELLVSTEGLRGYGTLEYEGQVPIKPYSCCFSRASVCIATYGMSVPSLHTESTDSETL